MAEQEGQPWIRPRNRCSSHLWCAGRSPICKCWRMELPRWEPWCSAPLRAHCALLHCTASYGNDKRTAACALRRSPKGENRAQARSGARGRRTGGMYRRFSADTLEYWSARCNVVGSSSLLAPTNISQRKCGAVLHYRTSMENCHAECDHNGHKRRAMGE